MTVQTAVVPAAPYKGLAPFEDSDLDELLFFGREQEREIVAANLVAARLTVLYGPSGVGKTSLLRAAVARELRSLPERPAVAVHSAWADNPVAGVAASVAEAGGIEAARSLVETVEQAFLVRGEVFLILDQLEEYFLYHGPASGPGTLVDELAELVARLEVPIHLLLGIREDALARLDAFRARMPGLFANSLRLDHLGRAAAKRAILGPLERLGELVPEEEGPTIEPALVDAVLDGVEAGKVLHGAGGRGVVKVERPTRAVETPYLQLVMQRVWDVERAEGSRVLRLATLERLGGASRIVEDHLERALASLTEEQKALAARMLNHLVTPSGTKIAHGAADLAGYTGASERELADVLDALSRERVLRPVAGDGVGGDTHEIFHDVLGPAVLAWRTRYVAERALERERATARSRHRRLAIVAAASLAALVAMVAVTIFALSQRSTARAETRNARARELAATANALLTTDPQRSVTLAARAALLLANTQIENDLRRALLESRVRRVFRVRGGLVGASFSPDGRRVVVAGADGRASIFAAHRGRLLRTLRHGTTLVSASFSPDGRLVLTAGGRTARLWVAGSGHSVSILVQRAEIATAAFDPVGSRIVTAGADGVVRIWTRSGRLVAQLRNPGPVRAMAVSPDGRLVAAIASDPAGHAQVRIFDVRAKRLVHVLPERGQLAVTFSPSGVVLATGSADRTARLWDVRSGRLLHVLPHKGHVVGLAFGPQGRYLATASEDGATRLWSVASGRRSLLVVGPTNYIESVAFSPDGNLFVASSLDRTARVYQTADGREVAVLRGHTDGVTSAVFSLDGRSVLTAGRDRTARLWDPGTGDQLRLLATHAGAVDAAAFSPDGTLALSAADDGTARLSNVATRREMATFRDGGKLTAATFSANGRFFLTAGENGTVRIRDTASRTLRRTLMAGAPLVAASLSADARLVITAGSDGSARVFAERSGPALHVLRHPEIAGAALSPDGRRAVTWGGVVARVWKVDTGRLEHELRGHRDEVVRASFSPDGRLLVTASSDATARLWDVATGRLLHALVGHRSGLTDAEFSPNGALVLTSSLDTDGRTWDVATGRLLHVLRGHFAAVSTATFSPDGRWIVTGSATTAGLWRTASGSLLFYLRGHRGQLTSASFSADGRRILTASVDGTVRMYDCDICPGIPGLLELARQRLGPAPLP